MSELLSSDVELRVGVDYCARTDDDLNARMSYWKAEKENSDRTDRSKMAVDLIVGHLAFELSQRKKEEALLDIDFVLEQSV